ncbi:unnamed protein product [Zymoseptoria tritici ST99CH_1E4]|uniref:Uncharacterized protein n=1 Tax=Zymoseptoria tritici ST99CH_1E4 TaxID=1276532 RepID=A0A2H1GUH4_ZYMTR|nr:unnamed protein product [Zymoseptoria tritici ST99CH_1E4]
MSSPTSNGTPNKNMAPDKNTTPDENVIYGPFPIDAEGYVLFKGPSHPIHNLYGEIPTCGLRAANPPARPPAPCCDYERVNGRRLGAEYQPPDPFCPRRTSDGAVQYWVDGEGFVDQ